jgi:hypothetical protein
MRILADSMRLAQPTAPRVHARVRYVRTYFYFYLQQASMLWCIALCGILATPHVTM